LVISESRDRRLGIFFLQGVYELREFPSMALLLVQLKRKYSRLKKRAHSMSEAARISGTMFCGKGVLWYALLLQLPVAAIAAQQRKYTPVVDVSVYSDVSQINSSTQARFVPMFGEPGDIDSSGDDGSTIRLRLESHSGMTLMTKALLRMSFQ
jgi:hypothetical protein